jgi:hypothetical protein
VQARISSATLSEELASELVRHAASPDPLKEILNTLNRLVTKTVLAGKPASGHLPRCTSLDYRQLIVQVTTITVSGVKIPLSRSLVMVKRTHCSGGIPSSSTKNRFNLMTWFTRLRRRFCHSGPEVPIHEQIPKK